MIKENNEYYDPLLDNINMAMLIPWRDQGSQGKAIVADVRTINEPFLYNNSS